MTSAIADTQAPSVNWLKLPWALLWFLPALSVVAGLITVFIAVRYGDSMVKDDYYRDGLAYNSEQTADQQAAALRLQAMLVQVGNTIIISLSAEQMPVVPDQLVLRLSHPTEAGADQVLRLKHQQGNQFQLMDVELPTTSWHVQLTPEDGSWRLRGRWSAPAPTQLKPEVH